MTTELPSPDDCVTIVERALAARDFDAVYAAMMCLAVQDPHRAEALRDTMLFGLYLADKRRDAPTREDHPR